LLPGVLAAARAGLYAGWRARGVVVNFLVRQPGRDALESLRGVGSQADRLLCMSDEVAQQLAQALAREAAPVRPLAPLR
jgi:hypothetical protein